MKSALMVWGGWEGHEPKQCTDVFAPFLEGAGYDVEVADSLDPFLDEDKMAELSLVVPCWTMGQISPEQAQGMLKAVYRGVGLAGWHGGMGDAFRANTDFQWMVGGQFVAHPGGQIDYRVNVTKPDDPIMEGIEDFDVKSEQYYLHVDPSNNVLATTTFNGDAAPWTRGCVMPQVWKRSYGKGRVFYSALGHATREFEKEEVRVIIERGLLWASL